MLEIQVALVLNYTLRQEIHVKSFLYASYDINYKCILNEEQR